MNGYIYVDKDGSEIMVYGSPELDGAMDEERFHRSAFITKADWERAALKRAEKLAKDFECEWGANW